MTTEFLNKIRAEINDYYYLVVRPNMGTTREHYTLAEKDVCKRNGIDYKEFIKAWND